MSNSKLQYYLLICDKKMQKKFMNLMYEYEVRGINCEYARGSANAGCIAKAFGFESEEHKVLLSGLISTPKAIELTETLKSKYKFHDNNTGFAFSIPVEGLSV